MEVSLRAGASGLHGDPTELHTRLRHRGRVLIVETALGKRQTGIFLIDCADRKGNVYVANGQIFVYDRTGKPVGQIDVPERPLGLIFGGGDGRTLFVLTHHALFAVKVRG